MGRFTTMFSALVILFFFIFLLSSSQGNIWISWFALLEAVNETTKPSSHSETRAENIFPLIIVSFSWINVYFLLTTRKAIKKLFPAKRFQHMGIISLALQMCYNKQIKEHLFEWPVISTAAVHGSCEQVLQS